MDETTQYFVGMISGGVFAMLMSVLFMWLRERGTLPSLIAAMLTASTFGFFSVLWIVGEHYAK